MLVADHQPLTPIVFAKATYNTPTVKTKANPSLLVEETCNFQMIGTGRNNTNTKSTVLTAAMEK